MGQDCFARWRLLPVVVCRGTAAGRVGGRAADTARRAGYVPLGRHLVFDYKSRTSWCFLHFLYQCATM